MRFLMLFISILSSTGCALNTANKASIWSVQEQAFISQEQLFTELAQAEILLIGEKHDNAYHHAQEVKVLQALAVQRAQASLVLEMLSLEQQPLVDTVKQNQILIEQDLARHLNWAAGWDWQQYQALINYSMQQPYPVLAANFSREQIRQLYRQPEQLIGAKSTALDITDKLTKQVQEAHCNQMPESQIPAMVGIQRSRDRLMANTLIKAEKPTALIAGGFHVRKDMGVPLHLADQGAKAVKVLLFVEKGQNMPANAADYLWYTPAAPEQDYCAQLN